MGQREGPILDICNAVLDLGTVLWEVPCLDTRLSLRQTAFKVQTSTEWH